MPSAGGGGAAPFGTLLSAESSTSCTSGVPCSAASASRAAWGTGQQCHFRHRDGISGCAKVHGISTLKDFVAVLGLN